VAGLRTRMDLQASGCVPWTRRQHREERAEQPAYSADG